MAQRQAVTKKKALAYRDASRKAKSRIWAVLRAPAGRLLAPMLPVLVPLLRREELELTAEQAGLLMRMSAATIDRKLGPSGRN